MADRENMELLCSRHFDGDLSDSEKKLLEEALERDAELKAFFDELESVHESVAKLAEAGRLPADFTDRIIGKLPDDAPVFRLSDVNWRGVVAAAAVVLVLGLVVGTSIINRGSGKPEGVPPLAFDKPGSVTPGAVEPGDTFESPGVDVVAYSDGDLELETTAGNTRHRHYQGRLQTPAQVRAPAGTHAVIQTGGGTVVLSPGATARLSDADADGMPDVEPIDGDIYVEGRKGAVRSRVADIGLSVNGGLTLRHTHQGYMAEPSHGASMIGAYSVRFRQCALISDGGVTLQDCDNFFLADWAIDGRADAILREVGTLLGDKFNQIPDGAWERSRRLLRGVLSRPAESATHAMSLRFLLKHGFFEDSTSEEIEAWTTIADILAEGTTKADIPVQILEMFENAERELERNPDMIRDFKRMIRESMERMAEQHRPHEQD